MKALDFGSLLAGLAGVSRETTQPQETLDRKLREKSITAAERSKRAAKKKRAAASRRKNRQR
jgi:hypothetical protein